MSPAIAVAVIIRVPAAPLADLAKALAVFVALRLLVGVLRRIHRERPEQVPMVGTIAGSIAGVVAFGVFVRVVPEVNVREAGLLPWREFDAPIAAGLAVFTAVMWSWARRPRVAQLVGFAAGLALAIKPFAFRFTFPDSASPGHTLVASWLSLDHLLYMVTGGLVMLVAFTLAGRRGGTRARTTTRTADR